MSTTIKAPFKFKLKDLQEVAKAQNIEVPRTSTIITSGVLILLSAVLLTIGILSLRIYQSCDESGQERSNINYYASIVGIGLGVGVLLYLLLNLTYNWYDKLPLILLSLVLIGIASTNIYLYNNDSFDTSQAVNIGLLGVGIGLTVGFGLLLLESLPTLLRLRIIGILLTAAVVVFSIFGINTYQKCDQPEEGRGSLITLAVLLAIGLLLFGGILASFFFAP